MLHQSSVLVITSIIRFGNAIHSILLRKSTTHKLSRKIDTRYTLSLSGVWLIVQAQRVFAAQIQASIVNWLAVIFNFGAARALVPLLVGANLRKGE
jgi:hypothetical protein